MVKLHIYDFRSDTFAGVFGPYSKIRGYNSYLECCDDDGNPVTFFDLTPNGIMYDTREYSEFVIYAEEDNNANKDSGN